MSREKKDRRDFDQLAQLADRMGLHRYFMTPLISFCCICFAPCLMIIYVMAAVSIPESSCLVRSPCLIIDQTLMTKDLKERYAELLIVLVLKDWSVYDFCICWLKYLLYRYLYLLACKEKLMRCFQTILHGREQTVRTFLMLPSQGQAAQTVSRLMKASMSSRIIRHQPMLWWRESKEGKAYSCVTSKLLGRFDYMQ